ncbi:MAG: 5'/3'-nucleotidase SurE, partial [Spirochaetales bacterium]|jgi:5'-nucleotidase|nr:5'/3'-nucleotidase SurE [Spirochaetales bacterium]
MKILLTNDDGIESIGLITLKTALEKSHDVWVVAPDRERSAMSHAVTLRDGVTFRQLGDQAFSCTGTPADCVLYSLLGALAFVPDLVMSGINRGPNIGTDIIYSGTVAAARQAALMGCPGIAVSLAGHDVNLDYTAAASFIVENAAALAGLWTDNHFININFPDKIVFSAGVCVTHPSRRVYEDNLVVRSESKTTKTFALEGALNYAEYEEGSDWEAIKSGAVSVSPILLHPLNQSGNEAYHSIKFKGPVAREQAG